MEFAGAEQWTDIELFGRTKQAWFEQLLEFPNGIPSHDTFGRIFSLIDPEAFQRCFIEWVKSLNTLICGYSHGQHLGSGQRAGPGANQNR